MTFTVYITGGRTKSTLCWKQFNRHVCPASAAAFLQYIYLAIGKMVGRGTK